MALGESNGHVIDDAWRILRPTWISWILTCIVNRLSDWNSSSPALLCIPHVSVLCQRLFHTFALVPTEVGYRPIYSTCFFTRRPNSHIHCQVICAQMSRFRIFCANLVNAVYRIFRFVSAFRDTYVHILQTYKKRLLALSSAAIDHWTNNKIKILKQESDLFQFSYFIISKLVKRTSYS